MSLWSESLERRVPQYVGGYLVGAWGLLQFIIFIESRYRLAGNLVELVGGILVLLFPSIVMLAWSHGRPGKDKWTRTQGWTTAVNLFIAAVVVFVFFRGKELGAVTQTIEVTDENGETIAREVPKADVVQRLTIFPFVNEIGNDNGADTGTDAEGNLDWIALGFPEVLAVDLYQTPFLDIKSPAHFPADLRDTDFDPVAGRLPRPIQLETARRFNTPWFVTGVLSKSGPDFVAETEILSTTTGRLKTSFIEKSPTLMGLVDRVSKRLREESELPAWAVEESVDLPVRDLLSENDEATRGLFEGLQLVYLDRKLEEGSQRVDEAVALDPGFAMAHLVRFTFKALLQDGAAANESVTLAVENDYRLPERMQFMARSNYYFRVKQDPDRARAVAEMWAKIYPYDMDAQRILLTFHFLRGEQAEATERLKRMVELSPSDRELTRALGQAQRRAGNLDEAARTFQDYVEMHPKDWQGYYQLGELELSRGNLEAAAEQLEKATLIETDNVRILLELAEVEKRQGHYDEHFKQLGEALEASKTPDDSLGVWNEFRDTHRLLGQYDTAVQYQEQAADLIRRVYDPSTRAERTSASMWLYSEAGRFAEGRRLMSEAESLLDPQFRALASAGVAILAIGERHFDEAEERIQKVQALGDQFKLADLQNLAKLLRGELALEAGDPAAAASLFEELLESTGDSTTNRRRLSRCYLELGRYDDARKQIDQALQSFPASPRSQLQLARVLKAQDDATGAIAALEIALQGWEDADEGHEQKTEAEAMMRDLKGAP